MSKELSAPFFALMAALWLPAIALAQRDAPVWDSYLPRISLFKERKTLDFELTFKKTGARSSSHLNARWSFSHTLKRTN